MTAERRAGLSTPGRIHPLVTPATAVTLHARPMSVARFSFLDWFGPPGSVGRPFGAALLIGGGMFAYSAWPMLLHREHVLDVLVHGSAWVDGVSVALIVLAFGLAARPAFRQPDAVWPRVAPLVAALLTALAVTAPWPIADQRLAADLVAHGVPAQARILRRFDGSCGKVGCSEEIAYSFAVPGNAEPVTGYAKITWHKFAPTLYPYGKLIVSYDPADPSRSAPDDGTLARTADPASLWFTLALYGGIGLLVCLVASPMLGVWTRRKATPTEAAAQQRGESGSSR